MKIDVVLEEKDLGMLCVCAIRYCHGRQSGMPDLIRKAVTPLLPQISDNDLAVMLMDCDFQESANLYGDERIDKPGWLMWKDTLLQEKERRKLER